jgi:hypothetical protein
MGMLLRRYHKVSNPNVDENTNTGENPNVDENTNTGENPNVDENTKGKGLVKDAGKNSESNSENNE